MYVVVLDVPVEDGGQMAASDDQESADALTACCTHPTLGETTGLHCRLHRIRALRRISAIPVRVWGAISGIGP